MKNLTEKYRPRTAEDFVGNAEALEQLRDYIKNDIPTILVGPPGCGKTTLAGIIANELGLSISEINSSDERRKAELMDLEVALTSRPLIPTLYLCDEADGIDNQDYLSEIIAKSNNPVILTANDKYKISLKLKKVCKMIEMKEPNLREVIDRMKHIASCEGVKVTYDKVSTDIRESINNVFYGADGYEKEKNNFEKVDNVFKRGKKEDIDPVWLLDNIHNYYHGKSLIEATNIIILYVTTGREEFLACLPRAKSGKAEYPYYFKKLKHNGNHGT